MFLWITLARLIPSFRLPKVLGESKALDPFQLSFWSDIFHYSVVWSTGWRHNDPPATYLPPLKKHFFLFQVVQSAVAYTKYFVSVVEISWKWTKQFYEEASYSQHMLRMLVQPIIYQPLVSSLHWLSHARLLERSFCVLEFLENWDVHQKDLVFGSCLYLVVLMDREEQRMFWWHFNSHFLS